MIVFPEYTDTKYKRGHCVYIIRCGIYFKIGITSDINNRLFALRGSNPLELEVLALIYTRKNGYLESHLHKTFKHKHHRSEWFLLDYETDVLKIRDFVPNEYLKSVNN